jgi:DNA (cytosine-5)-methyltransferase 1
MCSEQGILFMVIKYIDLFCGLGAFHTACNSQPDAFECVLACDIDEGARTIYEANYGLKPEGDIRQIDTETMPDFDILFAGFPCQPFSIAGNGEGFNDAEKGNLFYDILKIVDAKEPRMVFLENVKNLETHDSGNTFKTIQTELESRGYTFTSKVMNAAKYGSPQARQRIFMVATKGSAFVFPPEHEEEVPVSSIICRDAESVWDSSAYRFEEKTGKKRKFNPHVIMDVVSITTNKGGRQGERVYDVNSVGITVCASSGGPGAKTGLYKVGERVRRLTVEETLGMFGFPKDFKFPSISTEKRLFYLGNSIVVNVARACVPGIADWFRSA